MQYYFAKTTDDKKQEQLKVPSKSYFYCNCKLIHKNLD